MTTTTEKGIAEYLYHQAKLWPPTALEIAEGTGYPLSTVYATLRALQTERIKTGKNQFGYVLPESNAPVFDSVESSLGTVGGKSWIDAARSTTSTAARASLGLQTQITDIIEAYEAIGYRYLELAAHARAAQHRPDWQIVLGLMPDTEKE